VGWDSVVGLPTCVVLNSPGIEFLGGEIFCTCPDQPGGAPSLLYNGYKFSFSGVKWLGCGIDCPPACSAEVKERVDLYTSNPSLGLHALF
jgi:hypothetical protein